MRAIGLAVALLVGCEAVLWMFGPFLAPTIIRGEDRGYLFVPNMRSARLEHESGLLLRTYTNAFGALDREWSSQDLRARLKIAVIGNSFVAGKQVPLEDRFSERLERRLDDAGGDATVMNFGVDGQNIVNFLDLALYVDKTLQPDLIVLGLNDESNFAHTEQVTFRWGDRWVYRVHQGKFTVERQILTGPEQVVRFAIAVLRQSWLVRTLHQAFQTLQFNVPRMFADADRGRECPPWLATATTVGSPPDSVGLTMGIVREISANVSARLLVLEVPGDRSSPSSGPGACPWHRIGEWLATELHEAKIPLVVTADALAHSGRMTHFPGGHLNSDGHALIADLLAERISVLTAGSPVRQGLNRSPP